VTGLLTPEIEAMRGTVVEYEAPEELGRAAIRYFATAVGDDNPIYTDDGAARAAGHPGVVAPPTLVCETNQGVVRPRDAEGYIGHTWDVPVTGCRAIRGGNEYVFGRPVRPTDRITTRWELADLTEKESSDGRAMLIVTSIATYTNHEGEILATNTDTIIYQELER
jgi:acyl dehydratase